MKKEKATAAVRLYPSTRRKLNALAALQDMSLAAYLSEVSRSLS